MELNTTKLKVTPRLGYVLAKALTFEQTRDGIHLPDTSGLGQQIGEVLEVGPELEAAPVDDLSVGDQILVDNCFMVDPRTGKTSATMIQIDNERWMVHASDIVAKVVV